MVVYIALGLVLVSSLLETDNYKKAFKILGASANFIIIPSKLATSLVIVSMILAWPIVALDVCISRVLNNVNS